MDFLEFYGLKEDPFRLSPDPVFFYPSASHRAALDLLDYALEKKEGFCLVSGEPGTGKTTLLKVFMDRWKERADVALILTPRLGPEEFLEALLDELKVKGGGKGKVRLLKAFRDYLLERARRNRPVVIIVDEAQEIPDSTLEELRLLSNLETDKEKLLQVVLVGQPEMEKRLSTEGLRQLDQRITIRARLVPLAAGEMAAYINHRLIRAGKGFLRLDERMVRLIHRFSRGIPRIINVITSRTIMSAYLEGHNVVTEKHVRYAIDHLDGGEFPSGGEGGGRAFPAFYAAVAAVFFCAAIAAGYFIFFGGDARVEAGGNAAAVAEGAAQPPVPVNPVAASAGR